MIMMQRDIGNFMGMNPMMGEYRAGLGWLICSWEALWP